MSKLREYRTKHGISQEDFAKAVGVQKSAISRIEMGTRVPSMGLVARICQVTKGKLSAADFLPSPSPTRARAS